VCGPSSAEEDGIVPVDLPMSALSMSRSARVDAKALMRCGFQWSKVSRKWGWRVGRGRFSGVGGGSASGEGGGGLGKGEGADEKVGKSDGGDGDAIHSGRRVG
jgi:hypothetical protein